MVLPPGVVKTRRGWASCSSTEHHCSMHCRRRARRRSSTERHCRAEKELEAEMKRRQVLAKKRRKREEDRAAAQAEAGRGPGLGGCGRGVEGAGGLGEGGPEGTPQLVRSCGGCGCLTGQIWALRPHGAPKSRIFATSAIWPILRRWNVRKRATSGCALRGSRDENLSTFPPAHVLIQPGRVHCRVSGWPCPSWPAFPAQAGGRIARAR